MKGESYCPLGPDLLLCWTSISTVPIPLPPQVSFLILSHMVAWVGVTHPQFHQK